jgi:predicted Zn-dependent peptidase
MAHIEKAEMKDVRHFYRKYYHPGNATLVLAGNIDEKRSAELIEKWFGDIPKGDKVKRDYPSEPPQTSYRMAEVERPVPLDALFKVYHMPGRNDDAYYPVDLLSDILGRGKSSRLYTSLVKDRKVFNSISAYLLGSFDPGLFVISGKLNPGYRPEEGNLLVNEIVESLFSGFVKFEELEKVKNQAESSILFSEMELLNRAMGLAIANALGNTNLVNEELGKIRAVNLKDLINASQDILKEENCSTLFYRKSSEKPS